MTTTADTPQFFMLVAGIPSQLTREELIAIYSENANLKGLKLLRFDCPLLNIPLRMALLEVYKWTDTGRVAARFVCDQNRRAIPYVVAGCDSLCQDILARPLEVRVGCYGGRVAGVAALTTELKRYGDILLVDETLTADRVELKFEANSSYSYRDLTTTRFFKFNGVSLSIDTSDELISEGELLGLVPHIQTKFEIRSQDRTGLELKSFVEVYKNAKNGLKNLKYFNLKSLFNDGVWSYDDTLSCSESEEQSTEPKNLQFETCKVGNNSCLAFFSGSLDTARPLQESKSAKPTTLAVEPEPLKEGSGHSSRVVTVCEPTKTSKPTTLVDPVFTSQEVQSIIRSRQKPPKKEVTREQEIKTLQKYQDNTLEILAKLARLGIDVNKDFLTSLLQRVDPSTSPQELPKSFLKIVKTKFRKLKRREKKKMGKKGQIFSESEDLDSDDEDGVQCPKNGLKAGMTGESQLNEPACSKVGSNHPEIWLKFVNSLRPVETDKDELPVGDVKDVDVEDQDIHEPNKRTSISAKKQPINQFSGLGDHSKIFLHDRNEPTDDDYKFNQVNDIVKNILLSNYERRILLLQLQE